MPTSTSQWLTLLRSSSGTPSSLAAMNCARTSRKSITAPLRAIAAIANGPLTNHQSGQSKSPTQTRPSFSLPCFGALALALCHLQCSKLQVQLVRRQLEKDFGLDEKSLDCQRDLISDLVQEVR